MGVQVLEALARVAFPGRLRESEGESSGDSRGFKAPKELSQWWPRLPRSSMILSHGLCAFQHVFSLSEPWYPTP